MPTYSNGYIPEHLLIIFNRGRTVHRLSNGGTLVEDWYQGLTPASYAKHLRLVALAAQNNNGRGLRLSDGFSCYRPIYGQQIARTLYGNGAARVGTSSHGGYWEGQDTLAMDYGNWSYVYGGDRARWYADCRAVGLTPGMIEPRRGYPDEPWHVIDLDPWAPAPAGLDATPLEDDMDATQDARLKNVEQMLSDLRNRLTDPNPDNGAFGKIDRAYQSAADAARMATNISNQITDPNGGVLAAINRVGDGDVDVDALAGRLKDVLAPGIVTELAKRLAT